MCCVGFIVVVMMTMTSVIAELSIGVLPENTDRLYVIANTSGLYNVTVRENGEIVSEIQKPLVWEWDTEPRELRDNMSFHTGDRQIEFHSLQYEDYAIFTDIYGPESTYSVILKATDIATNQSITQVIPFTVIEPFYKIVSNNRIVVQTNSTGIIHTCQLNRPSNDIEWIITEIRPLNDGVLTMNDHTGMIYMEPKRDWIIHQGGMMRLTITGIIPNYGNVTQELRIYVQTYTDSFSFFEIWTDEILEHPTPTQHIVVKENRPIVIPLIAVVATGVQWFTQGVTPPGALITTNPDTLVLRPIKFKPNGANDFGIDLRAVYTTHDKSKTYNVSKHLNLLVTDVRDPPVWPMLEGSPLPILYIFIWITEDYLPANSLIDAHKAISPDRLPITYYLEPADIHLSAEGQRLKDRFTITVHKEKVYINTTEDLYPGNYLTQISASTFPHWTPLTVNYTIQIKPNTTISDNDDDTENDLSALVHLLWIILIGGPAGGGVYYFKKRRAAATVPPELPTPPETVQFLPRDDSC